MRHWSVERLVFIDESGINFAQTRAVARAPCGERVVDHVPAHWENYSLIAALRSTGIVAPMLLPGAMNTEALRTWVRDVLAPELRPGDIVIWDNLGIHSDPEVAVALAERGARLEFLPPYSPDFNPIEEAWSKIKCILRVAKARVFDALVDALGDALNAVCPDDCLGWFKHAGYLVL